MEIFYAFGITCIKMLQARFYDFEGYANAVNHIFNPQYLLELIFPMMCVCDSVFAAQLLLSLAFGGWFTTMLKWVMVEDRPFWWVRETTYYSNGERPILYQNSYTCETGPGSPSGHCAAAATVFMLIEMWISHFIRDTRSTRLLILYAKVPWKTIFFSFMSLIGISRMYVAAHFPHQCIMGALIGSFLSPSLCLYFTDPYLLRDSQSPQDVQRAVTRHVAMACSTIALSMLLGLVYLAMGVDINWSIRQAIRWCQEADSIDATTSPLFTIVQSTGSLLGWAIAVTPELSKYRHNTNRNFIVSLLSVTFANYCFNELQDYIPHRRIPFFILHFLLNVAKPYVLLKLIPRLAVATRLGDDRPPRQSRPVPAQLVTTGGAKRE